MKKNLLTSLKQLLKALGGENSNKNNAVQIIDEMTETLGGKTTLNSKNLVEAIDKLSNQVSQSDSNNSIPFPEVTVTLNIDHPESVDEVSLDDIYERNGNLFKHYHRSYGDGETAPQQSIITGGLLLGAGVYSAGEWIFSYGFNVEYFNIPATEVDKYFKLTVSDAVNMRDIDGGGLIFEVIDLSKPVSCTITATRMNSQ